MDVAPTSAPVTVTSRSPSADLFNSKKHPWSPLARLACFCAALIRANASAPPFTTSSKARDPNTLAHFQKSVCHPQKFSDTTAYSYERKIGPIVPLPKKNHQRVKNQLKHLATNNWPPAAALLRRLALMWSSHCCPERSITW